MIQKICSPFVLVLCLIFVRLDAAPAGPKTLKTWKAGLAKVVITPEKPIWMSGYASRNKPSEGKVHDLYAKALALEDPAGGRMVVVTTDLVGLSRSVAEEVALGEENSTCARAAADFVAYPHGPVIRDSLFTMYDLN
jgi:hypothetical protein